MMQIGGRLTSGKVPLEKTLAEKLAAGQSSAEWGRKRRSDELAETRLHGKDLHQQTGLSAGAISDDNELAAELGHGGEIEGLGLKS
jgi:hypothetical protein